MHLSTEFLCINLSLRPRSRSLSITSPPRGKVSPRRAWSYRFMELQPGRNRSTPSRTNIELNKLFLYSGDTSDPPYPNGTFGQSLSIQNMIRVSSFESYHRSKPQNASLTKQSLSIYCCQQNNEVISIHQDAMTTSNFNIPIQSRRA